LLDVDPRKRTQAAQLMKEPYVMCENVRMTAFEMASTIARNNDVKTFRRDLIKIAHNRAVDLLVSFNVFFI
jgi:hypothetical protein